MAKELSTEYVNPEDQFSYWVEAVCSTYMPIECSAESDREQMPGSIRVNQLGDIDLTITQSAPQTVSRTPSLVSAHQDDTFQISLQVSGRCLVHQNSRETIVYPGDFAYYDCSERFDLKFLDPFEIMIAKVPRALLAKHIRDPEALTAMKVPASTGTGALLKPMFEQLCSPDSSVGQSTVASQMLSEAIVCTTVAGLCTLPAVNQRRHSQLGCYHVERAKAFVRHHLNDAALTPTRVAAALSISEAHLHRLFQNEAQSISQFIWSQRLMACRSDLAQPRFSGRSITEVALSRGFSDVAHFSRRFRKEFGLSPRAWRNESQKT